MKPQLRIHNPGNAKAAPPPFVTTDPTVGQVIHWHENNPARKINSDVAEKERRRIWGLLRDALGDWRVADCKAFQALNFINAQAGLDSDWSRRRWNTTIQRPFNAAEKLQLIPRNPFRGLSFPQGRRGRDWTDAEYQQILRGTTACFRRVVIALRFSGMRPGEGRELQGPDVRADESKALIEKHKMRYLTKAARPIPLNIVLLKLFDWLKRHNPPGSKHLLLDSHDKPWTCHAVTQRLLKLRRKLGLPEDLKMHGMRHTFITRGLINGVDPAAMMEIVGHRQLATIQGYAHMANKTEHLEDSMTQAVTRKPKRKKPGPPPLFKELEKPIPEPTPLFDLLAE